MVTDTIGDFLTRIRNAQARQKESVSMPSSKMLVNIANILKEEGFISDFKEAEKKDQKQKELTLSLRYINNNPAIKGIERVSRPGLRLYVGYKDIRKVLEGLGISVLTTPKGVMTGEKARKQKVGGEYVCRVW